MRIFWSSMLDYFPFRKVNSSLILLQITAGLLIEFSAANKFTYLLAVSVSIMSEGSIAAIIPTVTLQKFGLIRGSQVYSFMFSAFGTSALFGSLLVTLLQDKIGFTGLKWIGILLGTIALFLTYVFNEKKSFDFQKLYTKLKKPSQPEITVTQYKNAEGVKMVCASTQTGSEADALYPRRKAKKVVGLYFEGQKTID
mmetsp:Transcript_13325/g.22638  ORF Transcript_13325/g.22638 Transcript_13325/m.22638 type:complete len:197 (+) Transcript_13325:922-1512(+)